MGDSRLRADGSRRRRRARTAWGALAFVFSLSLCVPFERQALAFAGLVFLLWSARAGRARPAVIAGLFAAWAILYSVEFGLFVFLGGAVGLLLLPLLESGFADWRLALRSGLRRTAPFVSGAILGALPFLLRLAARGGLGGFFRISFDETPRWPSFLSGSTRSLPADQARRLAALKKYLDARLTPAETFFDFCNQPALYFVMDRMMPIRYPTVAQYESLERQNDVIAELERVKPPIAILSWGIYSDLDISNAERAPEVSRYLSTHYEPDAVVDDWHIARRKARFPS